MMDRVILSVLFIFLAPMSNVAFASQDAGYKTLLIDGSSVPQSLGYQLDQLSLAAMKNGLLEPIPYQIDEYNIGGAVYFEGWDVPINGTKGVMDADDKLLFLLRDAGERRTHQNYDGTLIAEICVNGPDQQPRYVYLVHGSRLKSDEQYVRYSAAAARVETDFYDLRYNQENHLIWENFNVASYQGEGEPFDTMKIRLQAGVLTPVTKIKLNNNEIVAQPKGERIGAIRTTTQLEITMWMFEVPIFTASLQLHHYAKSLVYDMRVVVPEFRRALIVNPTASVSLDGNALMGANLLTAASPRDGAQVDGKMDSQERMLLEKGINEINNWMFTGTNRNLDLIAFFDFVADSKEPLSLILQDDDQFEDQPERFIGQLPNFGVQINNMPTSGVLGFVVSIYMDDKFHGKPESFSRALRTMPDIEVRSIRS